MKITILGTGALAIALCKLLEQDEDNRIVMWTKFEQEKVDLEQMRENIKLLPGVKISHDIQITNDIEKAIKGATVIINALPFIAVKDTVEKLSNIYNESQIILSVTKGIDDETFETTTEIFERVLNTKNVAALSGPSFAIDIVSKENLSFMLGSSNEKTIENISNLLKRDYIEIKVTDDILGIQLAGGIKNAIAIGSGILNGLKASDSTKAAYLAKGITDMANLIISFGGKKETTYTYAGVGDLILTCMSHNSRNYTFGSYIGEGFSVEQAFQKMDGKTVEGYKVIRALYKYIKDKQIKCEIINVLYDILFERGNIKKIKKI